MNRRRIVVVCQLVFLLSFTGCRPSERVIEVSVAIDFGPATKPAVEKKVAVVEAGTVFEALRRAFPIVTSGR
jgi:hypothetical protein